MTGSPGIAIDMDPAEWGRKRAVYESGSGTDALVFVHEVVEPNLSTQGIAVLADSLALHGGATIVSAATRTDAALGHTGRAHDPAHKVDWRLAPATETSGLPAVTGVEVVSDAGQRLDLPAGRGDPGAACFSEAVKVTGTPRLSIDMDPAEWGTKRAAYEGARDTAVLSLTFAHTVVEPNFSRRGSRCSRTRSRSTAGRSSRRRRARRRRSGTRGSATTRGTRWTGARRSRWRTRGRARAWTRR